MNYLKFSGVLALVLVLSLLFVPAYADETTPADDIGDFAGEHWSDIIGRLEDPENPLFDFSSSVEDVYVALTFVSSRVSTIWNTIPESYLIVLTLPIMLGAFFYLRSHVRIPSTRPEPGEYSTSESWTTTVTSRDGGEEHTIRTHSTTASLT